MTDGIWIRSQDKTCLGYSSVFHVQPADQKLLKSEGDYGMAGWVADENGRWGINCNNNYGRFAGIYSTKEKAMAVLNAIQRHVFLEDNVFVMPEDTSPNFKCEGGEIRYVD